MSAHTYKPNPTMLQHGKLASLLVSQQPVCGSLQSPRGNSSLESSHLLRIMLSKSLCSTRQSAPPPRLLTSAHTEDPKPRRLKAIESGMSPHSTQYSALLTRSPSRRSVNQQGMV